MHNNYNINQLSLDITTSFEPKENHVACFINELVESLQFSNPYIFGRPRKYDLGAMMKLVLFAYTRETFTSRKIERLAEENLYARWLTQEKIPSYRTIARFCISNDVQELTNQGLDRLTEYLRARNLIDDALFIDGTKILADANKFSFVWKKNTLRFDQMNREKIILMMAELKGAYDAKHIPEESNVTLDMLDELLTRMELRLEDLEKEVETTKEISPNPTKQQRRTLKSQQRKLNERRNKLVEYQEQMTIYGSRNSYSKTDLDATFMRVKEDHMMNGQLKPAYNLQLATCNQFVLGYDVFQNPTDTKTLQPLIEKMNLAKQSPRYIVADAGYGSESNYRYLEDELPQHTSLIPYGTMLKEQSKKWKTDERKVINWNYYEEDYYIDPRGVRFNFHAYREKT
ncbi:transposase, partial [Enterococcus sp. PF1-24]|uniref:transposase n=1 Tax=unclassified Enterococcus TaxID=2608891 RepID=UPI0024737D83